MFKSNSPKSHPKKPFVLQNIAAHWQDWLSDSGSLTERLIRLDSKGFSVKVLNERWQHASLNEAQLLGIKPRQLILVREVELICAKQTMVYARTLIPATSIIGPTRRLKKLGNRSLGTVLFSSKNMQRKDSWVEQTRLTNYTKKVWQRSSLFLLNNKPLLVTEAFLPALEQRILGVTDEH